MGNEVVSRKLSKVSVPYEFDTAHSKFERFKSIVNFKKKGDDQLTLKINDELELINRDYDDWWMMKNLRDQKIGLVQVTNIKSLDELADKP